MRDSMAENFKGETSTGAVESADASVSKEKTSKKPPWKSETLPQDAPIVSTFGMFALMNMLAALSAPIQDCDETFNYWEPTHYLQHGFGFQTWEYSPEYALRSWLYIAIHAIPGKIVSLMFKERVYQFYAIRMLLGISCACTQTRLCNAISKNLGSRVARIFQIIMLSSSGIFYASVAYLPSSFAMLTSMMGVSGFFNHQSTGSGAANGITWFGIGAIVGWPFSGALILPLLLDEFLFAGLSGISDSAFRILSGAFWVAVVGILDFAVNVFFYRKFIFIPWRLVSYNILSGASRGPDIFGTEPWHFYIRNLLLNFHFWFLLALCAGPLIVFQSLSRQKSTTRMSLLRSLIFVTPFYLWLAIFSLQPHKEERFMYPAYPFLCFNAAVTVHIIFFYLGHADPRTLIGRVPAQLKLLGVIGVTSGAVTLGLLRTTGTLTAYHAPLEVYRPLQSPEFAGQDGVVCLGKEWYRFPSSYFLPETMRAKFLKSAFDGLLPGQFKEISVEFGIPPTWLVPSGMNDQNIEDPGKHVDIERCSFLVDSEFSADILSPDPSQPNFFHGRFKDSSNSASILGARLGPGPSTLSATVGKILLDAPKIANYGVESRSLFAQVYQMQIIGYINWGQASKLNPTVLIKHIDTAAGFLVGYLIIMSSAVIAFTLRGSFGDYFIVSLCGGLIAFALSYVLYVKSLKGKNFFQQPSSSEPEKLHTKQSPSLKPPVRPLGKWTPSDFKRPVAIPLLDWDVHKTEPLPYRPFKFGPYHITMGLRSMQWDEWIELDNRFLAFHAEKARRIEERGDKCCKTAPEAMMGAIELLAEFCDYLPQRYPTMFEKTSVGMNNIITGETFDIIHRPLPEDPMAIAGRMVQDDLAIMFEKSDGQYYLLAGSILLAGFWRLSDKFGMPLSEIHTSGDVPGFKNKLEKGMMNFFRRIQPHSPVLRNNYFVQIDDNLAWSDSIGSEDADYESGQQQLEGWATAEKNKAIEHHHFRSERQSLRRLPRSGGVVFTIRTYFELITKIAQEPGVPGRLASGVRSWGDDVSKYKGKERYGDVLLDYLDKEHRKQVDMGLVNDSEDNDERATKYPF